MLVRNMDKKIQYDVFPITTTNEKNIASLPMLTSGKDTIRGGVEHQRA
jgi:hypothetical protein